MVAVQLLQQCTILHCLKSANDGNNNSSCNIHYNPLQEGGGQVTATNKTHHLETRVCHLVTRACGTNYPQTNASADVVRAGREGQWTG
jgi:hypothetical protein